MVFMKDKKILFIAAAAAVCAAILAVAAGGLLFSFVRGDDVYQLKSVRIDYEGMKSPLLPIDLHNFKPDIYLKVNGKKITPTQTDNCNFKINISDIDRKSTRWDQLKFKSDSYLTIEVWDENPVKTDKKLFDINVDKKHKQGRYDCYKWAVEFK